ncbi:glycosyltransferase [Brachybacterium kimchii]|uniref:Glycosyltransferase n=1 Tax=Brachybacterium kimchii TaxID=2942909 RepID=A0ABY4N3P0_9MICO|nr:glycosyltransferase [Brachybacterium kimchii]UQN28088.1 glycosyltransferase [Brachybacterium kimchii]
MAKDIYASVASGGTKTFDQLLRAVGEGDLSGWDPVWVARLARVLALQPYETGLREFAFRALRLSIDLIPVTGVTMYLRKILFEMLFERKEDTAARSLLESDPQLADLYHGYLAADLLNPYRNGSMASFKEWLPSFNRPFTAEGLSSVEVRTDALTPFDGLQGGVELGSIDGPLVSVIVTTFNPDPDEIRSSVRSILHQTWRSVEVLLIDDCSREESIQVLEDLAAEDSRVRLIRLSVNGGTYRARNAGIAAATGKYLTGQDTDDWSHPERIQRQVEFLEANQEQIGVTITANRTDHNLVKVSLGNKPERRCEVSLMVRVDTAMAVGGYLPVRKAADSEFRERIEKWSGVTVQRLDEPLYVIRMSPGSLSRADFRPGWSHHARRGFWSSYKHWHANADPEDLVVNAESPPVSIPSMAPARIAGREWMETKEFDVCVVADWRGTTEDQRAALDELRAMCTSELSVAVLHIDTPWGRTGDTRALVSGVQELISRGRARRVYLDQEIDAGLVLIRDPATMDYAREMRGSITADALLVVASGDPACSTAHLRPYDARHAHRMAESIFGLVPRWIAPEGVDPTVLMDTLELPMDEAVYPVYVDAERYSRAPLRRRQGRPVVGRVAQNELEDWPCRKDLPTVYPASEAIDLRVLGDARGAVRAMGKRRLPAEWLQYKTGDIAPDTFWRTVDAMMLFDQNLVERGLERSVLEALASGVPVVTDHRRGRLYGDAVVATDPSEALEVLLGLMAEPADLERLRAVGKRLIRNHADPQRLRTFIERRVRAARAGAERDA